METKYVIAGIGLFMVFIGFSVWWQVYKYHDCKRVGHSTFYCIMSIGK